MVFNGSMRQNSGNSLNVNTRLYVSYSEAAMIVIGAWNQQLSVKIHPFKGVNADGIRQYEQDNSGVIKTAITLDNAAAILRGVDEVIYPAFAGGSDASISVIIGSGETRKIMTFGVKDKKFYMTLGLNATEDNRVDMNAGNVLTHEFRSRSYIKNLDMATGAGDVVEVPTDFINFMKQIESVYLLQPATAHSIAYSEKVRAAFASQNGNGGGSYGNNGFQSQQMGGVPAYQAPTTTANSFAEFMERS